MNRIYLAALLAFGSFVSYSLADNWGHWRGPTGNSVATNANPPAEFSDTKNVKWKVAIPGRGSGSPVVWDNQVFVVTAVRADGSAEPASGGGGGRRRGGGRGQSGPTPKLHFKLLAFNRTNGELLWEKTATTST